MESNEKALKNLAFGIATIAAVGTTLFMQGCAGLGVRSINEVYRVDEASSTSVTRNAPKGLRCMFFDCEHEYKSAEQGS